jgi:S-(hydroxymethyl)glutathione dehydrogenase/alcohol dehydrogenase
MQPPLVVGHEGAGIVAEVGSGVADIAVGDHVVVALTAHDGTCVFCLAGHPALCFRTYELMQASASTDSALALNGKPVNRIGLLGTFAEQMIVAQECAVVIDPAMPLDLACLLGCAVLTGVGVVRNTVKAQAGDHVVVIGCGGVGLNTVQAAKLAGAAEIVAVDVSDEKLDAAKTFGATTVVHALRDDLNQVVASVCGGLGAHYAFESTGLTSCMSQAISALRPGGTAVLLGMASGSTPLVIDNIAEFILKEKRIAGSMMGSGIAKNDYTQLVSEYLDGSLLLEELVSRRRPLVEINEAIADLEAGRGLRTVFMF